MEDSKLEQYLDYIVNMQQKTYETLNEFNNVMNNQGTLVYSMAQLINLQSQALNEVSQNIRTLIAKLSDMEMRNNISDDSLSDMNQGISQMLQEIDDVKNKIDNLKIYKVVDGF